MPDSTDSPQATPPAADGTVQNGETQAKPPEKHDIKRHEEKPAQPPQETPSQNGESDQAERVVWVLLAMVGLSVFVLPVLFPKFAVPAGTVAALLTAITTLIISRQAGTRQ